MGENIYRHSYTWMIGIFKCTLHSSSGGKDALAGSCLCVVLSVRQVHRDPVSTHTQPCTHARMGTHRLHGWAHLCAGAHTLWHLSPGSWPVLSCKGLRAIQQQKTEPADVLRGCLLQFHGPEAAVG